MNTLPAPASAPAHPLPVSRLASIPMKCSAARVVLSLLLAALFSGCATTPLDRAAKMLAITVQTVDTEMRIYAELVARDMVSADVIQQVEKLYADYQAAEVVAETAITHAIKTRNTGGQVSANSSMSAAAAALTAASEPLLAFLARFTSP